MPADAPPAIAEAHVVDPTTRPRCSACKGRLPHHDQWRCPYVACRKWLRGRDDQPMVPGHAA